MEAPLFINKRMDKRFFDLILTPFFSCAMQGLNCKPSWYENVRLTADRINTLPASVRKDLLNGLKKELEHTERKLNSVSAAVRDDLKLKIEAIKELSKSIQ